MYIDDIIYDKERDKKLRRQIKRKIKERENKNEKKMKRQKGMSKDNRLNPYYLHCYFLLARPHVRAISSPLSYKRPVNRKIGWETEFATSGETFAEYE